MHGGCILKVGPVFNNRLQWLTPMSTTEFCKKMTSLTNRNKRDPCICICMYMTCKCYTLFLYYCKSKSEVDEVTNSSSI